MDIKERDKKLFQIGSIFTPRTPINARTLFSGRTSQISKVLDAISQQGAHALLYGERGVGKTSLSNVLSDYLKGVATLFHMPRINCDASDNFSTVWKKILKDFQVSRTKSGTGFLETNVEVTTNVIDSLPETIAPDDVRRVVMDLCKGVILVLIFDEYDRLRDRQAKIMMADTIKMFSDYAVTATILLIGVADTVDQLIEDHQSIERALVQIPMPRMSEQEIRDIIENGLTRAGMKIEDSARNLIINLSQGLPYITHLLSLHAAKAALQNLSALINDNHVHEGIDKALEEWQESIKTSYYNATRSQQPDTIYKQVLLACAMADKDELGYFSASSVRRPLQLITGKEYDIPNFARHLKEFTEPDRGQILEKSGEKRRIRYRFTGPLIQPYIIIRSSREDQS